MHKTRSAIYNRRLVKISMTEMNSGKGMKSKYRNIYDAVKESSYRFPEKTAIIEEEKSITYSELAEKIDIIAGWLKEEFKVKKGERIGVLFVNSIDFYIVFYAIVKLGCIAVMVNTKMQSEEIEYVLKDTDTHCLVLNERWFAKVEKILPDINVDRILTDHVPETKIQGVRSFSIDEILKQKKKRSGSMYTSIQEDDLTAVILHTSGTTGKPKGIMVSHTNMMETAYGYQEALRVSEKDISVLSVPVFHILGLSCVSNMFLYMGGTIVVFEKFDSNKVLGAIEKYHATHFHSVPAVYIKMMHEAERKYNLDSLRIAVCGGAVISNENKEKFYRMAPKASFRIAYGLTETAGSGVLSYRHGDPGREVMNCHITILNEDGSITEYGEGEALCEGSIVTTKVWGREDKDKEILHTGDIIRKEKNGDIFILDRIKDVINRGGEKLFPSLIEPVFLQYPGVEYASVFPVSDEILGEIPAAILVEKENEKINLEEIKKDLPGKIGKFELPQYLEIWKEEDIPVTGNGKVRKKALRQIFEDKLKNN